MLFKKHVFPVKDSIWKIHLDSHYHHLIIESKTEGHHFLYSLVDIEQKKFVFENSEFKVSEKIVSLVDFSYHYMVFHEFESIENPIASAVILFHVVNQKTSRYENHIFSGFDSDNTCFLQEHNQIKKLKIKEGEFYKTDIENINPSHALSFISPQKYYQGHVYFQDVAGFLYQRTKLEAKHQIDYLELESYIIIGTNIAKSERQMYYLFIFDKKGKIQYQEVLLDQIKGKSDGSFLFFDHSLIGTSGKILWCLEFPH